ncbi:hypothetical protein Tco_1413511, partial [Tanacetum coccineum]
LETTEHELDTLRAKVISAEQEIASLLARARAAEQQDVISRARISELEHRKMPTTQQGMTSDAIEQSIAQCVAATMTAYEANRDNGSGNWNETSRDSALTWWNSYMKIVGIDAAYEMSCKELMKMMTKGTDVVGYTQRFQELALLCLGMVPNEENKIEGYVLMLQDKLRTREDGRVTKGTTSTLEAEYGKGIHCWAWRKESVCWTFLYCNKCKLHHTGPCIVKCGNCKRVGHMTRTKTMEIKLGMEKLREKRMHWEEEKPTKILMSLQVKPMLCTLSIDMGFLA